ncbi:MAG TPA: DoxX family protein [Thermoplasmata archaeon]|nr:DoxX family protein [Thermoplasmata archaeon]
MAVVSASHERLDSWIYRNRERLKTGMRVLFGAVWGIDGVLKFGSGVPDSFSSMVQSAGNGQPAWLQGWFSFWAGQAAQNPTFWVYLTGVLEIALAAALLLGFARKVAYGGGILLSLFIWAVPEGFGGPYGPSSTDIGTGIVYAFVFLLLMIVNATYGPSRYSLDRLLERRWPGWSRIAEIRGPWVRDAPPRSGS